MLRGISACAITVITLMLAIAGCGAKKDNTDSVPEEAVQTSSVTITRKVADEIGLTTRLISKQSFTTFSSVPARVVADQDNEALVGSLVQGRVCKVFVKAGDYVQAGQEVMLVEGLEIGEIKAGFLSAKANLEYQKANYERQKKLLDENVGAQKTLLETQNEFEKASAEYNAEKNRINAIGLTEAEVVDGKIIHHSDNGSAALAVKAPISGIVVERNVVIGQLIEATTTAFRIVNLSSVWVDGQMYEKDMGKAAGKTPASFTTSSYPDERFNGTITYVGQIIDEKTRTITVRAEFSNPQRKLKPQMFGELKIPGVTVSDALLVPSEAVVKIENADYVFVQKQDSSFEKTAVQQGSSQNEQVEIRSGLNEGDRIVVKGAFYLKSELMKSALGGE